MDYTEYEFLDVEVRDRIAFVTLNRPDQLNATGETEHRELSRILRDVARDAAVAVVVATGAGKAFSVGGDQDYVMRLHDDPETCRSAMDEARELVFSAIDLEKPVVVALNGLAMGAGAAFALLGDIIVAERQARITDGHVRAALAAGDGGVLAWPISVGLVRAKRYLLTGDWLSAEEAERIGLVTEVVEQGESLERATEYARRLAAGPQTAIRYTKRALNQWLRTGVSSAFELSWALETLTFGTEEAGQAFADFRAGGTGSMPPDPRRRGGWAP